MADQVRQVLTAPDGDFPPPQPTPELDAIAGQQGDALDVLDALDEVVPEGPPPDIAEPEAEQVAELPPANLPVVEILRERRNEAIKQAGIARSQAATEREALAAQPSFLAKLASRAGLIKLPPPSALPDLPEAEEESSVVEQFTTPWVNRKRQIYGMVEGPILDHLAGKIVEIEAAYRRKQGLFEAGQVKRVTGAARYAELPPAAQAAWREQPDFKRLMRSSFYVSGDPSERSLPSLEQDIHTELLHGLPMVSDKAGMLAADYYRQMAKVSPEKIPAARGFFQKLASFGGNLGPFVAELAVMRRVLPINRLRAGIRAKVGQVGIKGVAGEAVARAGSEATLFGLRAATVPGEDPLAAAAFGALLGGAQGVGKAVGLAGKQGSNLAGAAGEAVGTAAVFGGAEAIRPGSDATDVLIAGVVAPIMFHARDLIRFRFSPRGVVSRKTVGAGNLPREWQGLRERSDPSSRLIYRFMLIGTRNPQATEEITATGKAIQELYGKYRKAEFRGVEDSEAALIEGFVRYYDPATVFRRAAEAGAPVAGREPIVPPSFVEPRAKAVVPPAEKPSIPIDTRLRRPEPMIPVGAARPTGKRGGPPVPPEPAPTPEPDIISERPFGPAELDSQGKSIERRLLRNLPAKPQINGRFPIEWALGRMDPGQYRELEENRPEIGDARRKNIDYLERLNAEVLRRRATAGGRKRQLLDVQHGQINAALFGLKFDRPDRAERPAPPARPDDLPTAAELVPGGAATGGEVKKRVRAKIKPAAAKLLEPLETVPTAAPGTPAVPAEPTPQEVTLPATPAAGAATEPAGAPEGVITPTTPERPGEATPTTETALQQRIRQDLAEIKRPLPLGQPALPVGQPALPGLEDVAADRLETEVRRLTIASDMLELIPDDPDKDLSIEDAREAFETIIEEYADMADRLEKLTIGSLQDQGVEKVSGALGNFRRDATIGEIRRLMDILSEYELETDLLLSQLYNRVSAQRKRAEADLSLVRATPDVAQRGIIDPEETTDVGRTGIAEPDDAVAGAPDRPGPAVLAPAPTAGVPAPQGEGGVGGPPGEPGGPVRGSIRPADRPGAGPGTGDRADAGDVVSPGGAGPGRRSVERGGGAVSAAGKRRGGIAGRSPQDVPTEPAAGVRPSEPPEGAQQPEGESPSRPQTRPSEPPAESPVGEVADYVIGPDEVTFPRGVATRVDTNIEVIKIIRDLETTRATPSDEERRLLIQYTGWGPNRDVFKGEFPERHGDVGRKMQPRFELLEEMLSDDEMATAKRSNQYAFFTPPAVSRAMWGLVERYGYTGGRVFEPGMGVGVFYGTMPAAMRPTTKRVGVEMDGISAQIANYLYPSSKIMHTPYQDAALPKDYFDLIIGNPPFANIRIADIRYPSRLRGTLHDYFFVRSLDLLRPGGLQVFIVSDGLMNKIDTSVRTYLAGIADLVGAVRLNNRMLDGTKATADIIVLRKRHDGEPPGGERWIESKPMAMSDPKQVDGGDRARRSVNEYFHRHPENVLGEFQVGSLYGEGGGPTDSIVVPSAASKGLSAALAALPEIDYRYETAADSVDDRTPEELIPAPKNMPVGTYVVEGHTLRQVMRDRTMAAVEQGILEKARATGSRDPRAVKAANTRAVNKVRKIKKLVGLRDRVLEFQRAMLDPKSTEADLAARQKALNEEYDRFVRAEKATHSPVNASALAGDAYTRGVVFAIEKWNPTSKTATKGDIFTTRILEPPPEEIANTVDEALAVSLNESAGGELDLARIAEILQEPAELVKQQLIDEDLAYELPDGRLQTADEYLSGDSRGKLEDAQNAVALDKRFARNVAALEKIIPTDLGIDKIKVQMGAVWIPVEVYQEFADSIFPRGVRIAYLAGTGKWLISDTGNVKASVAARDTWGTREVDGIKIFNHAMRFSLPIVKERVPDPDDPSKTKLVMDEGATRLAGIKLRDLRERFEAWLWESPERVVDLLPLYNRLNNSQVPRTWSGKHLTFPGMSPFWRKRFERRDYQPRTVWRAIAHQGNTLANLAVGSGKTAIGAAFAMEIRRRGIARKPLIVVQNATYEAFPAEFAAMYPTAKLYSVSTKDMAGDRRVRAFADIALGDWDAIIMPHSTFELIPAGDATVRDYFRARIEESVQSEQDARVERQASGELDAGTDSKGRSKDPVIREIEKRREALENKMQEKLQRLEVFRRKGGLTFEETGIDYLIIDESQKYKNLAYATSATRIKGMGDPAGNAITFDAHMKIEYVQRLQNGKGLMFMTGTPISNTITEAYIMQKYLQPEVLREKGLANADAWLKAYGVITGGVEKKVQGTYDVVTRLRAVTNKTDFMRDWLNMTESVSQQDMVQKYGVVLPLMSKNEKGERGYRLHKISMDEAMTEFLGGVQAYATWILENFREAMETGHSFLRVTSLMKDGAFDLRQVDEEYAETEDHKIKQASGEILRKYKELTGFDILKHNPDLTAELLDADDIPHDNGKVNGVQLVFLDRGINPRAWGFHGYGDLIDRLVTGGIPRNEIATIHDWDKRRPELFRKVNRGEIRVLIGTTEKMGIGVNVQKLAAAAHFIVPPWRPDYMTQAVGRVIRSGNLFKEVDLNLYAMENLDEFFYDKLFAKMTFLDQFNSRELDEVREVEEPSLDTLTFAEVKALTTANPFVIPHEEAKRKVSELVSERGGFRRQLSGLVDEKKQAEVDLTNTVAGQNTLRKQIDFLEPTEGKPFEMKVAGTTFEKSDDAGRAILQELVDLADTFAGMKPEARGRSRGEASERQIGAYRGFRVVIEWSDPTDAAVRLVAPPTIGLHGWRVYVKLAHLKDMETATTEQPPVGLIQKLRNTIGDSKKRLATLEGDETRQREKVSDLAAALEGKQWGKESELARSREDVESLEQQLTAYQAEEPAGGEAAAARFRGVELEEQPDKDPEIDEPEEEGGAAQLPDFPPGPAALRPPSVFPSHFTSEMKRYVRKQLDPTKPGYGMGTMANMPDPLNTWKQMVDNFVRRLEEAPKESRFGRVSKYFARGLYGDQWGLSEEMYGYFRRVKGAERMAKFDSAHTFQRFLRERRRQIQYDYGKADGGPIYRKFEKQLAEVIDGKADPSTLTPDQRSWFESLKARIDGITVDTLKFPEQYLAAFGLRNIGEVIRTRMLGTGTHLRALYIPVSQFPNRFDEKRAAQRLVGRGPRIRGAIFKVRRSDKGIPNRDTWTLGHADGTFTQFFKEADAFEAFQKELDDHKAALGESRFKKITLQDSFNRDMVPALQPVEDLATRVAATLTLMEHNLATLKLFDYIDATHALTIDEGEQIPENYELVQDQPEFGPIAGKYVDHHIMDNLMDFDRVHRNMFAKAWNAYHYVWKSFKTIWNAGTWKNNAMGNLFFNALAGQNPITHPKYFARAAREILAGRRGEGQSGEGPGSLWRSLVKENWMNVGFHTEFFNRFAELMESGAVHEPRFEGRLGELMEEMIPKLQAVNEAAGQAYDFVDQVSIMVKHMRNLDEGMSHEESIEELWMFPNYANAGKFANWARNSPVGSSFIMFTEQSAKIMLRSVRSRPGTLFALMALPGLLTMLSAIILGVSDEEWKLINTDFQRKGSWGGDRWLNRYFQPMLPIRTADGKLQTFDVRWSFPLANDFRVDMGRGGIGSSMLLNTPLTRAIMETRSGIDLYTGREISPEDHEGMRRFTDHVLNIIGEIEPLPRMITRTWRNLWRVIQNEDERSWWEALANGIFGTTIRAARLNRSEVFKLIKKEIGEPGANAWLKLAELYNTVYRPADTKPISPRSVLRAKIRTEAQVQQREQRDKERRERIRRGKLKARIVR